MGSSQTCTRSVCSTDRKSVLYLTELAFWNSKKSSDTQRALFSRNWVKVPSLRSYHTFFIDFPRFLTSDFSFRWELHGAVSWGSGRCDTKSDQVYTVFAKVLHFKDWIIALTGCKYTFGKKCRQKMTKILAIGFSPTKLYFADYFFYQQTLKSSLMLLFLASD